MTELSTAYAVPDNTQGVLTLTEKEKVIDKVYTDTKTGYGSIKSTFDDAKK